MRLRFGTHAALEDEATEMITQMLRGYGLCSCYPGEEGCGQCDGTGWVRTGPPVTSREEKSDVLTPWKLEDRLEHEIFCSTGTADPAVRCGMFNRAWNRARPDLNSRDGAYPMRRLTPTLDYAGGGYEDGRDYGED